MIAGRILRPPEAPSAKRRPCASPTTGQIFIKQRRAGATELVLPGSGSNHMMPLLSSMPVDGDTTCDPNADNRSEEHTSELQSLMRISYAVFCLKTKKETDKVPDNVNT